VVGTYSEIVIEGGKKAWENNNIILFFSEEGSFQDSWTIHNKVTDDYLVLITGDNYKGDSFPPMGSTTTWQLFPNGAVVPSDDYVDLTIDYQETCNPSQVPTKAPTETPTLKPTEVYLCVIVTWDLDDSSFSAIPEDFYGAYYYNDLVFLSNNEFNKFPIHPSTRNTKIVFTKKRNDNTVSFFLESDDPVDSDTWVIDSNDHTYQLVSSDPNHGSEYPKYTDFPEGSVVTPPAEYTWTLYQNGVASTEHVIRIEMSRELVICENFDTDQPTTIPTAFPTRSPTPRPSVMPTPMPSPMPSIVPTPAPSPSPSAMPSPSPTDRPTSQLPTSLPTPVPTQYPTVDYECIRVRAVDVANGRYDGLYSVQSTPRNGRNWYKDGNTGFDLYFVPSAVIMSNAWVLEGSSKDYLSIHEIDVGTWTQYGQVDEVPPYGTFTWLQFASPPVPSSYVGIDLILEPVEHCEPTLGPTERPTEFPTTSTPAPTTPSPTVVPTITPTKLPSTPPSGTPTGNPTEVCYVLGISTPNEPGGTSVFEGTYVIQSVWKNGNAVWYNSNTGYYIYFVDDDWLPSSWIFQGDEGMDELAVFDEGTDGHPNTVDDGFPSGEEWILFYWGHNLQKREATVFVVIHCIPSFPPTNIPTPGPSPLPSTPPTSLPSPMPSLNPSPSPSPQPSTVPTPMPSPMPSLQPSPSPTASPTLPTNTPTSIPSPTPTFYPTYVCPCIYISSANNSIFDGMYQLGDPHNNRDKWINFDTSAELYSSDYGSDRLYWEISRGLLGSVLPKEERERFGVNPPIGEHDWSAATGPSRYYHVYTLLLECSTCIPTPSPTQSPTNVITPSPTTPAPTVVPTVSPSPMPSTVPTPSPTKLPTTLDPTPLSAEPTLMPSPSPTALPSTPLPSTSPSSMPSPSPSPMPSIVPTPSPTANPIQPTTMPTPAPTKIPTTPLPSASPSSMPSPSPSPSPSVLPTPSPSKLPTTSEPSTSPSAMPSPSPSPSPSSMPSPSPSPHPTTMPSLSPTAVPTVTCLCLEVVDLDQEVSGYAGFYRHNSTYSPNTNKWMWERAGYGTQEKIYYSKFGSAAARWKIQGSNYGKWAEISADESEPKPPQRGSWLIDGSFYQDLSIECSQCEITPAPTPDPTESPTQVPTSLAPTGVPTSSPSIYCMVLNITDFTNGFYNGYFEMDVLPYNGKHKWTDPKTGESLYWADTAMLESEGPVDNIWVLGFQEDAGDDDSHFLVFKAGYSSPYPHIDSIEEWLEYTFNTYSNQNSSIMIDCHETEIPTQFPTKYPSEPLCTELIVHTCCDPVYTNFDGSYQAMAHRGGKDMFVNGINGYAIYYTRNGGYWSIRSEDDADLIYVENTEDNGKYPPFDSYWDLENHVLTDLEVMISIGCSATFSPSSTPTHIPTDGPTFDPTTLNPSPMPTQEPTFEPTELPTEAPSEACMALYIEDLDGETLKFNGEYSRLTSEKNGKAQWLNYNTGSDVYWVDRGVWANTWILRASDGDYLMFHEDQPDAIHPPLSAEWASLGYDIIHGEKYQDLMIRCSSTQPPAPRPTTSPTLAPTCVGNSIHIEDRCNSEYSGYYNNEYVHDDKNAYVRVDGKYEVIFIGEDIFAGKWMVRPYDADSCEEFFLIDGDSDQHIPPENAFWEAYACGCSSADVKFECNFRVTCMHTKAPIPTEQPSHSPTSAPIDTPSPSYDPTQYPSPAPTNTPTDEPTNDPTRLPSSEPTTRMPTQAPVPYDCTSVHLQPCTNITGRVVTFYERDNNQMQVHSNYYETKLYTEQKGYTFVASQDMVMNEAGMAFVNLASYQSITVRVFDNSAMLYESDYSYDGNGVTVTTGSPRGDYYTFKNLNVQLRSGEEYTVVFVVHCPATKSSRAEYPLCAPNHEVYSIDEFGSSIENVYAYGEDYEIPTESDLYAPFVIICYSPVYTY